MLGAELIYRLKADESWLQNSTRSAEQKERRVEVGTKAALIAGASCGLGLALAVELASRGWPFSQLSANKEEPRFTIQLPTSSG
jgi:hypothetical protein